MSGEVPHCSRGAHRASMALGPPFAIVPAPPNFTMRPLRACIDVLIVCSAAAVLVTTLRMYQSGLAEQSDIESTRAALSTIDAEIGIRSALQKWLARIIAALARSVRLHSTMRTAQRHLHHITHDA